MNFIAEILIEACTTLSENNEDFHNFIHKYKITKTDFYQALILHDAKKSEIIKDVTEKIVGIVAINYEELCFHQLRTLDEKARSMHQRNYLMQMKTVLDDMCFNGTKLRYQKNTHDAYLNCIIAAAFSVSIELKIKNIFKKKSKIVLISLLKELLQFKKFNDFFEEENINLESLEMAIAGRFVNTFPLAKSKLFKIFDFLSQQIITVDGDVLHILKYVTERDKLQMECKGISMIASYAMILSYHHYLVLTFNTISDSFDVSNIQAI